MHGSQHLHPDVAAWLVSAVGQDCVRSATAALDSGDDVLRIGTRLRRCGIEPAYAASVTEAAQARRMARTRWHDADRLLFTLQGLEQASDPAVSRWRAERFRHAHVVEDRAAGIGGDSLTIAATGAHVVAVDLDEARLILLAHNAAVRGVEVTTVVDDALRRPPPADFPVHVDPSRRSGRRRARSLREYQPPVADVLGHLAEARTGGGLAVVLSPAVALDDPDLPVGDVELEFVQVGSRLVETVAWLGPLRRSAAARASATLLPDQAPADKRPLTPVTRLRTTDVARLPVGPIGSVILEIAPAAVRARLHDELGAEVGARRIATRRAMLTVDGEVPASPWWRRHRVEAVLPPRAKAVRRWLRSADDRPVELSLHGAAVDVEHFWYGLGRPRRGPQGRRIALVRTDAGTAAIVTVAYGT